MSRTNHQPDPVAEVGDHRADQDQQGGPDFARHLRVKWNHGDPDAAVLREFLFEQLADALHLELSRLEARLPLKPRHDP